MNYNTNSARISVRIDPLIASEIALYCAKHRMSKSEFHRVAIRNFLNEEVDKGLRGDCDANRVAFLIEYVQIVCDDFVSEHLKDKRPGYIKKSQDRVIAYHDIAGDEK